MTLMRLIALQYFKRLTALEMILYTSDGLCNHGLTWRWERRRRRPCWGPRWRSRPGRSPRPCWRSWPRSGPGRSSAAAWSCCRYRSSRWRARCQGGWTSPSRSERRQQLTRHSTGIITQEGIMETLIMLLRFKSTFKKQNKKIGKSINVVHLKPI